MWKSQVILASWEDKEFHTLEAQIALMNTVDIVIAFPGAGLLNFLYTPDVS